MEHPNLVGLWHFCDALCLVLEDYPDFRESMPHERLSLLADAYDFLGHPLAVMAADPQLPTEFLPGWLEDAELFLEFFESQEHYRHIASAGGTNLLDQLSDAILELQRIDNPDVPAEQRPHPAALMPEVERLKAFFQRFTAFVGRKAGLAKVYDS
jgi:hypothetical protein